MKNPHAQKAWDLIEESGVKRRFVAKRIGISYGYLNQLTYGHAPFTSEVRARFAVYFDVPESELFAGPDASRPRGKKAEVERPD